MTSYVMMLGIWYSLRATQEKAIRIPVSQCYNAQEDITQIKNRDRQDIRSMRAYNRGYVGTGAERGSIRCLKERNEWS